MAEAKASLLLQGGNAMFLRVWTSAVVLLTGAALLLSGCGDTLESKSAATAPTDLSGVTLVLGDQAKGLRTVVEAANALEGIDYKVEWANFQGAAPLFEALRAGAVDLGLAGDTPVLAAATGGTPLRIVDPGARRFGHS
jgi:sulfonate transport system substrate-binding protein